MNKELAEFYINYSLDCTVDFSELFYEEKETNELKLVNSKIDKVDTFFQKGLGVRLAYKDKISYGSMNDISEANLKKVIDELKKNFKSKRVIDHVTLKEETNTKIFEEMPLKAKKDLLYKIDTLARKVDPRVDNVTVSLSNQKQNVIISNSKGKYVSDQRIYTLLVVNIIVKENGVTSTSNERYGYSTDYSFLNKINYEEEIKDLVKKAILGLKAIPMKGGLMPAVIGPGFGAVIFHEAVGHALEATTVAQKTSVLTNKFNKKIGSDKVTLIDDGTIKDLWGTTLYDDEGNKTQKNILINKGVITSYLIDELNSRKMNMSITGSGRRESYKYAPTSRMNNTYLMPGTDSFEDMIKSIENGLYAKTMGGGSVNPITGDFNFAVQEGYIIKNGKICEQVKLVSLIGNTLEILKQVEMVSDDLDYGVGFCGSISGYVNTTIGEPSIKVSKILVGGAE